jgi:hypothetical protein
MRALAISRMVRLDIEFNRHRRGDGENVNAMASSRCVLNQVLIFSHSKVPSGPSVAMTRWEGFGVLLKK